MFDKRYTVDALVVGAGPVGLATAASMIHAGIRPAIIDARWHAAHRTGSVLLHPQSLTLLKELGAVHAVLGAGQRIQRVEFLDEEGRRHARADLSGLGTPYPFGLVVPQQIVLQALVDSLAAHDVPVRWHHRLTALEGEGSALIARVDELDRESAGYGVAHMEEIVERSVSFDTPAVIGASGESYVLPHHVGARRERIGSDGVAVVFELDDTSSPRDEARVIFGPHGATTILPLPGGRVQWTFLVEGGTFAESGLTMHGFRGLAGSRAHWYDTQAADVSFADVEPYESHVATERGRGRVWLVGAAAYGAPPLMSHPLNLGLAEGQAVGRALAHALAGTGSFGEVERISRQLALEQRTDLEPGAYVAVNAGADAFVEEHAVAMARAVPARPPAWDAIGAQLGLRVARAA